jgi:pyruvate carboxylase
VPGRAVVTVAVARGNDVLVGQTVATIEAMKMEAAITAPKAGTVQRIAVSARVSAKSHFTWSGVV